MHEKAPGTSSGVASHFELLPYLLGGARLSQALGVEPAEVIEFAAAIEERAAAPVNSWFVKKITNSLSRRCGLTEDGGNTAYGLDEMDRAAALLQAQATMLDVPSIA